MNKFKISIVMSYYNYRKKQLINTLNQFESLYSYKYNFEVVIVDDNSSEEFKLYDIINNYSFMINYIIISKEEKGERVNPCIAYNRGFKESTGDIIIIQNPECYHVGDIIDYIYKNIDKTKYLTFSCYSTNSEELTEELINSNNKFYKIKDSNFNNKNLFASNSNNLWYNHPIYKNVSYHFCSAIYKSNLDILGGFDENFANGYCYDDDELILSIKYNLKLNIFNIDPSEVFVIHQYHEKNNSFNISDEDNNNIIKQKWLLNKNLFELKEKNYMKNTTISTKIPKIFFTYWEGKQLSKLHYYTILSFLKLNPNYSIIIYSSEIISNKFINLATREYSIEIYNIITLDEILNIDKERIKLININFEYEYNISSNLSIIYKADFIRIAKLYEHGGLWFDFDIFFIKPIPDFLFESNIDIYYFSYYDTIPTGLLLSSPKNNMLRILFHIALEKLKNEDSNEHQFIGPDLWINIFNNNKDLLNKSICLAKEIIYPYDWLDYSNFFYNNDNNFIKENTIGANWFNGGSDSRKYINNFNENNINPENSVFEKYLFYIINL